MVNAYVHGYHPRENTRLQDQASTLEELLHSDTHFPPGSRILEAGCGVGAQTVPLARNSPHSLITAVDISEASAGEARRNVAAAGLTNVQVLQGDIFNLPFQNRALSTIFSSVLFLNISLDRSRRSLSSRISSSPAARSQQSKGIMVPPTSIPIARRPTKRFRARSNCRGEQVAMP